MLIRWSTGGVAVRLRGGLLAAALVCVGCTVQRVPAGLSPAFLRVESLIRASDLRAVSPPAWAPQGTWLAFSTREGVWVLGSDLSEYREHRIASLPHVTHVAWAPDGRSLAALADGSLYALSAEGAPPRRLSGDRRVRRFAWAPQGNQIAYVASGDGYLGVWLVPGNGGGKTRVDVRLGPATETEEVQALSWYPDGRDLFVALGPSGGARVDRFLQIRAPRSLITRLSLPLGGPAASPVLSPSGRFLAYLSGTEADLRAGRGRVMVVRADGTGARALTSQGGYSGLAWSRAGNLLAFAAADDEALSIIVADAVTGERLEVAHYRPEISRHVGSAAVAWSPDSLRIAFGTNTGETMGLVWIVTLHRQ